MTEVNCVSNKVVFLNPKAPVLHVFDETDVLATTVVIFPASTTRAATTPHTLLLEASHPPYILVVDILAGHHVLESRHEGSLCKLLLTRRMDNPI
jgi:hypothetical protein